MGVRNKAWALFAVLAVFTTASMVASPKVALAQPSLDTRTWRPSTDPGASLVLEPTQVQARGGWALGTFAHYTHRPVVLFRRGSDEAAYTPVGNLVGMDLGGSYGLFDRVAVGAILPVMVYQTGSSGMPARVVEQGKVPQAGVGDVHLTLKGNLADNKDGGFGLAALSRVSLPTGDTRSFMGEGAVTASARLLAEYSLVFAAVQGSLGYKLRTERRTWPEPDGVRAGDEIPWTFGLALRPSLLGVDEGNRQKVELSLHGALPAGPVGPFGAGDPGSAVLSPVMLAVSDRVEIGRFRDAYAVVGADFGLTTALGVPAARAIVGLGWAPREHDRDHDGVPDDVDQCPTDAEDADGFEDTDGCPDIDNDEDGIVDREDACPHVKGVASTDPRTNGCPATDRDGDGDGITDDVDACPDERGEASGTPALNGCPQRDRDGDGIPDHQDRCPDQPEDKDGFEDDDGCPDPDNDRDGIMDVDDACPMVKGDPSVDPKQNGCPNPDRDGDTYPNDVDRCPDAPETFNGKDDEDGCPDEGGKPLVSLTWDERDQARAILARPIQFTGPADAPDVAPDSVVLLRALAHELHKERGLTVAVGARPLGGKPEDAQAASLARAFAVVRVLGQLTNRHVAETVSWEAVRKLPPAGAEPNVNFLFLSAPVAMESRRLPMVTGP